MSAHGPEHFNATNGDFQSPEDYDESAWRRASLPARFDAPLPNEAERCSCLWADDDADGESGPSPYIVRIAEDCPQHSRVSARVIETDDREEALRAYRKDGANSRVVYSPRAKRETKRIVIPLYDHATEEEAAEILDGLRAFGFSLEPRFEDDAR